MSRKLLIPTILLVPTMLAAILLGLTVVPSADAHPRDAHPRDARALPITKADPGDPDDPGDTAPPPPPFKEIRLQVIRTSNDDGTHFNNVTENDIVNQLVDINAVYAPLGIRFVFDPTADFTTMQDSQLNKMFAVAGNLANYTDPEVAPPVVTAPYTAARRAVADQYRGKLVLFFARPDKLWYNSVSMQWTLILSNYSSSSHNERHVSIAGNPGYKVLAHEIGHYLHLIHPFEDLATVEDAVDLIETELANGTPVANGLRALDHDKAYVLDTPADASEDVWEDYFGVGQLCAGPENQSIPLTVSVPGGGSMVYQLQPNRRLTMSYFECTPLVFSPQQGQRVHDAIDILNRHDLISEPPTSTTSLVRRGSGYAGAIVDVEAVRVAPGRIVTLVRTSNAMMKVIPWDVSESGAITRAGSGAYAGPVSDMVGTSMGLDNLVTAIRNGAGELELISWKIHPDGFVERLSTVVDIPIQQVKIARFDMLNVVTAVQTPAGDLKVIAWQLDADGRMWRLAEADAGEVDGFDVSPSWLGATTSVRDGSGNLRVINWQVRKVAGAWNVFRKGTSVGASTESEIAATGMDIPSHGATSYTDASDWLKVSTWATTYDGIVQPRSTHHVGATCSEIDAERLGTEILAIGCRVTANGNLLMVLLDIGPGGQGISFLDQDYTGAISAVSLARAHQDIVVSALRNGSGNLQLIAWQRQDSTFQF